MVARDWELLHHTATTPVSDPEKIASLHQARDGIIYLLEQGYQPRITDLNDIMACVAYVEEYLQAHGAACQAYLDAQVQKCVGNACKDDHLFPEAGDGLLLQGYKDQQ